MKRVSYSSDVKWKCIQLKAAGLSTKEIMDELKYVNESLKMYGKVSLLGYLFYHICTLSYYIVYITVAFS